MRVRLGHESFAVSCLLALAGAASDAIRVPRLTVYAPRFLSTLGRPCAVAFHLPCCGQLGRGLAPRRSRPCWAHKKKPPEGGPSFAAREARRDYFEAAADAAEAAAAAESAAADAEPAAAEAAADDVSAAGAGAGAGSAAGAGAGAGAGSSFLPQAARAAAATRVARTSDFFISVSFLGMGTTIPELCPGGLSR